MKKFFLFLLLIPLSTTAQPIDALRRSSPNWPLTVSLQFHNLSMPFRDMKSVFSNVGLALGTEFAYNRRASLVQSFQMGYYRNRSVGDGLFVNTQTVYRPSAGPVFAELKAGAGWAYSYHPTPTLTFREGEWQTSRRTGKGMPMIPFGVALGYKGRYASPFISYQAFALLGYNPSVPVVPNQLLQIGSRIALHR